MLTPERLKEIRDHILKETWGTNSFGLDVIKELLAEIDKLRAELNERYTRSIRCELCDKLKVELDELRVENKNLSEAHEAAQHYKQERDELIAHARTDLPELARRLKRAIESIRTAATKFRNPVTFERMNELAEELESPLGEPEPHEWTKVLREDAE